MAVWHHWLDGRESEWTPGVGDGQGGLACCNSWGRRESDMTEWLNWTELNNILLDIRICQIYQLYSLRHHLFFSHDMYQNQNFPFIYMVIWLAFRSLKKTMGFPDSSVGKESACNAGNPDLIPGLGRSPGEGKGYPLQYCGLENSMDCIVHGVTKSQTWLSNFD